MLHEEKINPNLVDGEALSHDVVWYLDTGASNHMTGSRSQFSELDEAVTGTVKFEDGSFVQIHGKGTVLFKGLRGEHRVLSGVYYIPKLCSSIVSLGQLDENGYMSVIDRGYSRVYDRNKNLLAKVERGRNRLYMLNLKIASPVCLLGEITDKTWLWHARFGHLNFQALNLMSRIGMVEGMPRVEHITQFCDGCVLGKHKCAPFPQAAQFRASQRLQLLHCDLCGPISPASPAGNKYFLLLVDDFSRHMWVEMLKKKGEALSMFKKVKTRLELEIDTKLKSFRIDRGGEFTLKEFHQYCDELGIMHFLTAPYSPQQNGVVERRNQTVLAAARSMLKSKHVPSVFWAEAVKAAVYVLNRSSTRSVEGATPYERWTGRKPKFHHLRVFGSLVHVKTVGPHTKKLSDMSVPMVFFGYESGSKAYRAYDPKERKLHVSRDIVFQEDKEWQWDLLDLPNGISEISGNTSVVHYEQDEIVQPDVPVTPVATQTSSMQQSGGAVV